MALKSFKHESMYSLQMYTQYIENQSSELMQFLEMLKKNLQEDKISQSFYDENLEDIKAQVESNNETLNSIEKELSSRIRRNFPNLKTFKQLEIMGKSFETELKNYSELLTKKNKPEEEKVPVKKVDFTASREKTLKKDD